MVKNNKYIAIQNGCNNIICSEDDDGDDKRVCGTLTEATKVVEDAISEDGYGYDSCEGDVVVYELVPVKIAKTPNSVIWTKA